MLLYKETKPKQTNLILINIKVHFRKWIHREEEEEEEEENLN